MAIPYSKSPSDLFDITLIIKKDSTLDFKNTKYINIKVEILISFINKNDCTL